MPNLSIRALKILLLNLATTCCLPQVAFDDGDHLDGIVSFSIVSEQEYFDNFGELSPPTPGRGKRQKKGPEKFRGLSPCELRKKRCKNCAMCSKRDCGLCLSCRSNSRQTSTSKECCLQKVETLVVQTYSFGPFSISHYSFPFFY